MTLNTRWFRIDFLTSNRNDFGLGWLWRPRFIRPWDRSRAVSWGNWHLVVTRHPNAAERKVQRQEYKQAVRAFMAQSKQEGWVS